MEANVTELNETGNAVATPNFAKIAQNLWKTAPLVLIAFGTVGNMVSVSVLMRKKLRTTSSSIYLIALTVTDLLILYFGLFRRWMMNYLDFDLRVAMGCGAHIWLLYTFLGCSSWNLVALTIERVIIVKFPVYARNGFSRRSAILVLLILVLVMASFNLLYIFAYENKTQHSDSPSSQNTSATKLRCVRLTEMVFVVDLWFWLDLSLTSLTPFVFMVVGNSCIGYELIRRQKRKEQAQQNLHQKSIIKLLILLCLMFALTTLPIRITLCLVPAESSLWKDGGFKLWWAVANMIMYTNNAINFLLYCSFGTNFRSEIKVMFKEMIQWLCLIATNIKELTPHTFDNLSYETEEININDEGRTNYRMSNSETTSYAESPLQTYTSTNGR